MVFTVSIKNNFLLKRKLYGFFVRTLYDLNEREKNRAAFMILDF